MFYFFRMELRERIITEAFELFVKYGIRSVTMDQVSGELGISKRTLYETFKDKGELLREGLDHYAKIHRAEALEIAEKADNVIQAIYLLTRSGEEMKQRVNPLFFEDIKKYYRDVHLMLTTDGRYRDHTLTMQLLRKGVRDGLFKKNLNIELVNSFFHEIMTLVMNEEVFPEDRFSDEDVFRSIIMPYLVGICTQKGQEQIRKYFEKEIKL